MADGETLFLSLGECLLRQPGWPDQAAIARAMSTSRSAIHPWVNHLLHHRALRFRGDRLEADRSRLMAVLTAHRIAAHRPEAPFRIALEPEAAHRALEGAGVPHCFAFFTAANQWAFYEPRRDLDLYVERGSLGRVREVLAPPPSRVRRAGGLAHPFLERVRAIPATARSGLPVTSPLLTVLDLRAHPEGGAHAAFLEEVVLPRALGAVA